MKQYDVYGIGNALVDMDYEVSAQDLIDMNIEKGVMTLVEEDHQMRVMAHLGSHPCKKSAGGSAANSVIAVSQFGGKGFYSCKVADDELGNFYLQDLQANGVDTNVHAVREAGHTGRCLVMVTPDADRTMATHLGITGGLSQVELVEDKLRSADYAYIEGYLVTSDSARSAAIHARQIAEQAGVKTSLSLSDPNMVKFFKDGLESMIGSSVDLLFANESEAMGMAGSDNLEDAITYLKTRSRQFAVTLGPKGALVWDGAKLIEIEPTPVKAVDTVGAGDMFAGAFLYGLTQGWDHARAGRLASKASAHLVTAYGPRISAAQAKGLLEGI
ncbi:MAG: adenosine kinase [Gammaproteobacteria bacterium]|nr:adenosine kinase [Gammaproteobacteria bacterium]MCP5137286.1 adenosine kinase [Gammaproteobacteria bacterium]